MPWPGKIAGGNARDSIGMADLHAGVGHTADAHISEGPAIDERQRLKCLADRAFALARAVGQAESLAGINDGLDFGFQGGFEIAQFLSTVVSDLQLPHGFIKAFRDVPGIGLRACRGKQVFVNESQSLQFRGILDDRPLMGDPLA